MDNFESERKKPRAAVAEEEGDHVQVPQGELTRDAFYSTPVKGDRTLMCWALQTETNVRLAKVKAREARDNPSSSTAAATTTTTTTSKTLDSEYLLQVYPDVPAPEGFKKPSRGDPYESCVFCSDWLAYQRKCKDELAVIREPDPDWYGGVESLSVEGYGARNEEFSRKSERKKAVPPNMLYFRIILEGFLCYEVEYNRNDTAMPRAALMGGAVVAVLTAWRDSAIINMFDESNINWSLMKKAPGAVSMAERVEYYKARGSLLKKLREYFLDDTDPKSVFSSGDADFFLQASPLTRSLVAKLCSAGLDGLAMRTISEYLGGCGMVHEDLHRFGDVTLEDDIFMLQHRSTGEFVYALAKNGLSAMMGTRIDDHYNGNPNFPRGFPRTLQLIMLNEQADLLGGLLDFDISVASCAYDGVHVYVTPRAAFSLMTLTQVVTPFVLQESRNRKRIGKYYVRGFDAYVVDPNDTRSRQLVVGEDMRIIRRSTGEGPPFDRNKFEMSGVDFPTRERRARLWLRGLSVRRSHDQASYGRLLGRIRDDRDKIKLFCDEADNQSDEQSDEQSDDQYEPPTVNKPKWPHSTRVRHSVEVFELSEGDCVAYLAKRDNWSQEKRALAAQTPPHLQYVCRRCKWAYLIDRKILPNEPTLEDAEDALHDVTHYSQGNHFHPSFYAAPLFNSSYVRDSARSVFEILSSLSSQEFIEKCRYVKKKGDMGGYAPRFVKGYLIDEVFKDAGKVVFPETGRAPVGLNPERFISKCKSCRTWLNGYEFRAEYCRACEEERQSDEEDGG